MLFDDVDALRASGNGGEGIYQYGRNGSPTQWSLSAALTELEAGAAGTKLFPSGLAAISMALMSVVKPGEELLIADSVYGPTRAFCDNVLGRLGVIVRYYDPLIGRAIEGLITNKTRAIYMESPGSLTMEVQDVPGICDVARSKGITTLLDNTWATPVLFQALSSGVDLSILSCTKYIVGHSDALLGAVTSNCDRFSALEAQCRLFGQHVSPDDAWLALRGLRTLGVRLEQHGRTALKLANWLKAHPRVARVLHPALPSSPGHEYWLRDFLGASGLFTFALKDCDNDDSTRFINALKLFGIGYSWGGFESLALPVEPKSVRTVSKGNWESPLIRLHAGLEVVDDLLADLEKGFAALG
jgi:cystathionine beta-lyase